MDGFIFDWARTATSAANLATIGGAIAAPLALGIVDRRPEAVLRGALLAASGALYMVRTQAAITGATRGVVTDMPPEAFAALVSLILMLIWVAFWLIVIPTACERLVSGSHRFARWGWGMFLALALYAILFIIGPLPGAIAQGAHKVNARADAAMARTEAQVAATRHSNALTACITVADLRSRLDDMPPTVAELAARTRDRMDRVTHQWGVKPDASMDQCTASLKSRASGELQAFAKQIMAVYAAAFSARRLQERAWVAEPEAADEPVVTSAGLGLRPFFARAVQSPWQQVVATSTQLDLPSTWLLLAEAMVALLTLMQALNQRRLTQTAANGERRQ